MPKPRKFARPLDPNHELSDEDEGERGNKLTAMLEKAMEKQNGRLDEIKTETSRCTKDVAKLSADYSDLCKRVDKAENIIKSNKAKLADYETKLADLEDRDQDNVRILGIPEEAEGSNASQFISTNLLKWFPNLGEQRMEIMRVHRVGPSATGNRSPRTPICKVLRFTDRDRILQALRKTPVKFQGQEICFSADFSSYTVMQRWAFSPAMEEARKQSLQAFLLYPARLKLIHGQDQHIGVDLFTFDQQE
uniref:uncharacterized protein LOC122760028 n=1 Tax=Solea senegalensis TaxID=28829 RepID=UPI001CD86BB2|nr:uncharacterized protein LOC122760028 [Solea senegalensis]